MQFRVLVCDLSSLVEPPCLLASDCVVVVNMVELVVVVVMVVMIVIMVVKL
jgi:hypothetical protein